MEVRRMAGDAIAAYLDDLARLRIRVFREFPYLYDGSAEDEQEYLQAYSRSVDGVIVVALHDGDVVGVSTGLPLVEADQAFRSPFEMAGWDIEQIFYLGESVLDPRFRGQGIGHRFFDEREAHARDRGFDITCFCAVERTVDHPLKPADYRPHDAFWAKRGYTIRPDLKAHLHWKQVDAPDPVENTLTFHLRHHGTR